jgi:ribosomal protein S18 acetylase RimI-like enzyme
MLWWHRPKDEPLKVRLAGPLDRPALAHLLAHSGRHFGAQAVEEQMTLLNSGVSSLALSGNRAVGFLGLRPRSAADTECWADVSMAIIESGWGSERLLATLWDAGLPALHQAGVTGAVCLTGESWLREGLHAVGFAQPDRVITYLRHDFSAVPPVVDHPAVLRTAGAAHAGVVLMLNAAAFVPLWRYEEATTLNWLLTSDHAMLAEVDGQPAGFALTTCAGLDGYAQLIRVGVHPDWQGHGIGRQLVVDAIQFARASSAVGVALNTQSSNAASRHLYESLGFRSIGSAVDVLVSTIE